MDKTFVFLGSSVTYGVDDYSMCEVVAEQTGAAVVKWAVSGTTLSASCPNSYVKRMLDVIDAQDACDHFICQLSTNDAGRGCPLGEISDSFDAADFDTNTTLGAMEFIIATARARWSCPISFYTSYPFPSDKYPLMVEKLHEIAEKWEIGILDLWNDAEMQTVTPEDYAVYMRDPCHPTVLGYQKWWGPKFIDYLTK